MIILIMAPALRITTAKNGIMETTPDQRYLVLHYTMV